MSIAMVGSSVLKVVLVVGEPAPQWSLQDTQGHSKIEERRPKKVESFVDGQLPQLFVCLLAVYMTLRVSFLLGKRAVNFAPPFLQRQMAGLNLNRNRGTWSLLQANRRKREGIKYARHGSDGTEYAYSVPRTRRCTGRRYYCRQSLVLPWFFHPFSRVRYGGPQR